MLARAPAFLAFKREGRRERALPPRRCSPRRDSVPLRPAAAAAAAAIAAAQESDADDSDDSSSGSDADDDDDEDVSGDDSSSSGADSEDEDIDVYAQADDLHAADFGGAEELRALDVTPEEFADVEAYEAAIRELSPEMQAVFNTVAPMLGGAAVLGASRLACNMRICTAFRHRLSLHVRGSSSALSS